MNLRNLLIVLAALCAFLTLVGVVALGPLLALGVLFLCGALLVP